MATKLGIYNRALVFCGERRLTSVSEDREPRHVLDAIYDEVVTYCLEQGIWSWALDSRSLSSDSLPTINFGYSNAYSRPGSVIHPFAFYDGATSNDPITDVIDTGANYLANTANLHLVYTSTTNGEVLASWPEMFAKFTALELASNACYRLTGNFELEARLFELAEFELSRVLATYSLVSDIGRRPFNNLIRRELNPGADPEPQTPFYRRSLLFSGNDDRG